jgi:AcrR family transcriptional regulator
MVRGVKRDGAATRLSLIRTAERLFLEKGLEAVSLREISAAARQKNHSAAGYHFGSKEGVVDAVLLRHSLPLHGGYDVAMDAVDAAVARGAAPGLRAVLELLVRPIVAKLDDEDGGRAYLSLCAQLAVSERMPLETRAVATAPPVLRISQAVMARVAIPSALLPLRLARLAGNIYTSILQYDRLDRRGALQVSRDAFVEDLVDALACMLGTEIRLG